MSATLPYHSRHTGRQVDDAVGRAIKQYSGSFDLSAGADTGSITGLGLTFTPNRAYLQIESPAGGFVILAVVVRDSMTADGFDFMLSGEPDSINYRLHYFLETDPEAAS